jgi:hypothetical protein
MPNRIEPIGTYISGCEQTCWRCRKQIKENEIVLVCSNTTYCKDCGEKIVRKAFQNHNILLSTMLEELTRED